MKAELQWGYGSTSCLKSKRLYRKGTRRRPPNTWNDFHPVGQVHSGLCSFSRVKDMGNGGLSCAGFNLHRLQTALLILHYNIVSEDVDSTLSR